MKKLILALSLSATSPLAAEVHSFGILGDAGVWNYEAEQVRTSMQTGGITQLILPGDNLYFDDDYDTVWRHWSDFSKPVVAIGNHHIGYDREIAYFGMPGPYYSRSFGDQVKFLVINSDDVSTADAQIAWLRNELEASTVPFLFIVAHHPPYTVSDYHDWDERVEITAPLRTLLQQYQEKITSLIVGHDHIATLVMVDDLPMVVSGASWQVRRGRHNEYRASDERMVRTAWRFNNRDPYWTRLDIDDGRGTVWLNFVRANGGVECSVQLKPTFLMRRNCG